MYYAKQKSIIQNWKGFYNSLILHSVVILKATHWPQQSAEKKNRSSTQRCDHSVENQQCKKKIGQKDSLFWAAESILRALISDNSFTFFTADLLSVRVSLSLMFSHRPLSYYFSLRSLKDRSMERESSCLRLSYRLSQPCREKFLAICWIQVWWCVLVAHLWLHFLTWHSCD